MTVRATVKRPGGRNGAEGRSGDGETIGRPLERQPESSTCDRATPPGPCGARAVFPFCGGRAPSTTLLPGSYAAVFGRTGEVAFGCFRAMASAPRGPMRAAARLASVSSGLPCARGARFERVSRDCPSQLASGAGGQRLPSRPPTVAPPVRPKTASDTPGRGALRGTRRSNRGPETGPGGGAAGVADPLAGALLGAVGLVSVGPCKAGPRGRMTSTDNARGEGVGRAVGVCSPGRRSFAEPLPPRSEPPGVMAAFERSAGSGPRAPTQPDARAPRPARRRVGVLMAITLFLPYQGPVAGDISSGA